MWSLGCLVHELLTTQKPFCDADDIDDIDTDIMSGLETALDVQEPMVNMGLLYEYCCGKSEFPTEVLHRSHASVEAIDLVKSLLVADPVARSTATSALQSTWLATVEFKNDWFKRLEAEFLEMSVDLDVGTDQDKSLMRPIRSIDVSRFLPPLRSQQSACNTGAGNR